MLIFLRFDHDPEKCQSILRNDRNSSNTARSGGVNSDKTSVAHEEFGRFVRDLLVKRGASEHDAAVVAHGLVWANLRGSDGILSQFL